MILVEGIPSKIVRGNAALTDKPTAQHSLLLQDSTLRPRIWKILLRVDDLSAETFLQYVSRGPCEVREKIRNDTFR